MTDFTVNWLWPQWTILTLLLISLLISAARNGKPMLQTDGDGKGQPIKYNSSVTLIKFTIIIAILICGGFFK